VINSKD